ncbi:nitrilase-related carbon-nitrogen hydrolase [Ahniella affigens]|nr:nitrilase-related carbon-nitrogen hydrolase [Ahniella affigens]
MDSVPTDLQPPAPEGAQAPSRRLLIVGALVSACLLFLSTGLAPIPWLMLIAPVPILIPAYRHNMLLALGMVLMCWAISGLNLFGYLRGVLELPLLIIALAILTPAWHAALAFFISKRLHDRGQMILAAFALPAIWASLNYLDARVSPHGSFGNLAYSQMDNVWLSQVLAWTGLWGLDFLLIWVPTALALAAAPTHAGKRRRLLALAVVPLLLVVAGATWRLQPTTTGPSIRVAALAYDEPAFPMPGDDPATQALFQRIDQELADLYQQDVRYVVLPEVIARLDPAQIKAQSQHWQSLADQYQMTLVIGVAELTKPNEHNAAWVIQPGQAQLRYFKQHLLPFFEDRYEAGTASQVVDSDNLRFGTAICKDLDFPKLGRDYGLAGSQLLFVPAWDFGVDGSLHARMAVFRGIENGFAVLRAARRGELTLSDAQGRILASAPSSGGRLLADLPIAPHMPTLYLRIGNAFAWLCLLVSLLATVVAFWPRRAGTL